MSFWCWHRWTKWDAYEWRGLHYGNALLRFDKPIEISERRQRRHCEKCGKQQDELV